MESKRRVSPGWVLPIVLLAVGAGCGSSSGGTGHATDKQLRQAIAEAGIEPVDPGPAPSAAKIALGQALMFDKELGGNRDISCATCHHPLMHSADDLSVSIGTKGRGLGPARELGEGRHFIPRNAPDAFNRALPEWTTMFWDMRVSGSPETGFITPAGDNLPEGLESVLAAQAMFPVTSPDEMRGIPGDHDVFGKVNELANIPDDDLPAIWAGLMARLLAIPEYVALFAAAYPGVPAESLGFQHAANAIGAFEGSAFLFVDSPWDSYVAGDNSALDEDAKRGALLFFGKAGCANCHTGNLFTDQKAHDIAAPQVGPGRGEAAPQDIGRAAITGNDADLYAFRTPSLRNVTLTGPWMHDGAYTTLRAAVLHLLDPEAALNSYDPSQLSPPLQSTFQGDPATIDAILANLDEDAQPRYLTEEEIDQLLAFLTALSDPAAGDLSSLIPYSVPSGLPVSD